MHPADATHANAIGIIRLLLAGAVIYSHSFFLGGFAEEPLMIWTDGRMALGPFAVHVFFVLSGYLVTESFLRSQSTASYLWKRALRLLPGLWTCLIVTAFVFTPLAWWLQDPPRPALSSLWPDQVDYVLGNLFSPRARLAVGDYPSGSIPWKGDWNGSLWTLFYEGACYLMVAALGMLGFLKKWARAGLALLLGFIGLHIVWRLFPGLLPDLARRLFDTSGKQATLHFFAGMAWCLAPRAITAHLARPAVAWACAVIVVLSWFSPALPWVSPLVLPSLVFALAASPSLINWDRCLGGDYSYGIYIYGMPVQQCLACLGVHRFGWTVYFVASLAGAFAIAWVSWRFIEKPALRLKSLQFPRFWPARSIRQTSLP